MLETADELDSEPILIGMPGRPTPYERLRKRYFEAVGSIYPPSQQASDDEEFIAGDDGIIFVGAGIPEKGPTDKGGTQPLRPYMTGGTLPRKSAPPPPPPPPDPNQKYRDANAEAEARSAEKARQGKINKSKKDNLRKRRGG